CGNVPRLPIALPRRERRARLRIRVTARAAAALVVVLAAWLYFDRLDYAPPYVEIDEVLIGLDGHAIATTGRDLRGEFLPLYSQTAEHSWYQPMVIYLTAAALTVVSLSEWAVRLPTASIGILDVVLVLAVARQFLGSWLAGAAA